MKCQLINREDVLELKESNQHFDLCIIVKIVLVTDH